MPTPVFAAQNAGSRIYRIGRVGIDSGTSDTGGSYVSTLKTEKFSPAGENGLCYFRRAAVRIWHTSNFTVTMRMYVDGVRTKVYSGGVLVDQTVSITQAAPSTSPTETVVEASLQAQGTYIEVELELTSTNVNGVFLPEHIEIGYLPVKQSKSRGAEST